MDKKKAFTVAFNELKSMVPLKERNQLYVGLVSKLEKAMQGYVKERISATVLDNARVHELETERLNERILHLESFLDDAGIKHKILSEEVYPEKFKNR